MRQSFVAEAPRFERHNFKKFWETRCTAINFVPPNKHSIRRQEPKAFDTMSDDCQLKTLVLQNARRSKSIYADTTGSATGRKRIRLDPAQTSEPGLDKAALSLRLHAEYDDVLTLPEAIASKLPTTGPTRKKRTKAPAEAAPDKSEEQTRKLIEGIPTTQPARQGAGGPNSDALVLARKPVAAQAGAGASGGQRGQAEQMSLVRRSDVSSQPRPDWHPPWKLMRVISGHLGWVRALAVDPDNKYFASGAGDRTIKIWDMATGSLRLTLTGHISTVRGLAISPRHPYLFSCGEDKMVKCWDLEQNKVCVSFVLYLGTSSLPSCRDAATRRKVQNTNNAR